MKLVIEEYPSIMSKSFNTNAIDITLGYDMLHHHNVNQTEISFVTIRLESGRDGDSIFSLLAKPRKKVKVTIEIEDDESEAGAWT